MTFMLSSAMVAGPGIGTEVRGNIFRVSLPRNCSLGGVCGGVEGRGVSSVRDVFGN